MIGATIHSYIMLAAEQAKKYSLAEEQKKQIKNTWQKQKGGAKNKPQVIKRTKADKTTSTSTTSNKQHKNLKSYLYKF